MYKNMSLQNCVLIIYAKEKQLYKKIFEMTDARIFGLTSKSILAAYVSYELKTSCKRF